MSDPNPNSAAATLSAHADSIRALTATPATRYLVMVEGQSSAILHLPSHGELIVGRAPDVQVRVQDPTASRRHAKLVLSEMETTLIDLGSHNGTQVNGESISGPRALHAGDVISVCDVTLVLKQQIHHSPDRALITLFQAQHRFEEELARALEYRREMALLCFDTRDANQCKRAAEVVANSLRRIDCLAIGGGAELVLLLPEMDLDEAAEKAEDLLRVIAEIAPGSRAGVAVCPDDGGDIESLLSAARAATEAAPAGTALAASTMASTILVAEQRIVVSDPAMIRLYKLIERLAQSPIPVLINGETGAGKELAAAAIHYWSPRRSGKLITVNCAALPETLVESELFGHERGAFSGAVSTKLGLFESAHGGTLFLDEIGELPAAAQAKFLRALETKRITRVGGTQERAVDVRVVAATNRNLEQEVAQGRFRQDLYFRLSAATVMLLPLRGRRRELPILARNFLLEACQRASRLPMTISVGAMHRLLAYGWPGNLRELRNTMDFIAATCTEPVLLPCHLPERIGPQGTPLQHDAALAKPVESPARQFRPLEEELRELERTRMVEALAATGGLQNRAAELLAMPLRTFASKIKLYGLSRRSAPT